MSDRPHNSFPFSPSPFLGKAVSGQARPFAGNTPGAGVTEFYISDERGKSRPGFGAGKSAGDTSLPDHLLALLSRQKTPLQSDVRKAGLRLLSLESFVWGSRGFPPRPRTRPDHTLIWVFAGNLQLDYPRHGQPVGRDSVHYIPAGTAFAAVPKPGAAGFVLLLSHSVTCDIDPPFPSTILSGIAGDAGDKLLATVTSLASENQAQPCAGTRKLMASLARQLSDLQPATAPTRPARNANVENRPLVERFLALASTCLGQGHTIGELAEKLGTGTVALDQACLNAHGKRAVELIHQLRLEQAIERLRNGGHSPAQIAKDLGYTSLAHFTRAFVEATGRSPESFRRDH